MGADTACGGQACGADEECCNVADSNGTCSLYCLRGTTCPAVSCVSACGCSATEICCNAHASGTNTCTLQCISATTCPSVSCTVPTGDAGSDATPGSDAFAGEAAASDGAISDSGGGSCAPGTCRFEYDPTGPCLPPGGPVGGGDGSLSGCCGCGNDGFCSAECVCASPDTPIATPAGDRPIASLSEGDVVLSINRGEVAAVPLRRVRRRAVTNHRVVEVTLANGSTLRISAAHPTADGRSFGDLHAGDWLGGFEVGSARVVPYSEDATYDILPDSDTGTYFAGGALIGSTLVRIGSSHHPPPEACVLPSNIR